VPLKVAVGIRLGVADGRLVGRAVRVAVGVALAVGVAVGASVGVGSGGGTYNAWPTYMVLEDRQFAARNAVTVVPVRRDMLNRVSPRTT
jgi:hypothetical protein